LKLQRFVMKITYETTERHSQMLRLAITTNQKLFGQLCIGVAVSSLFLRPSIVGLSLGVRLGGGVL
jgi:hypothetical protein